MSNARIRHCATCTCTMRRRFTIDDQLLEMVRVLFHMGGVDAVAEGCQRSRSQAYRLVARAKMTDQTARDRPPPTSTHDLTD